MPFIGTILLLAAVVSAILIPLFVGHGLASHNNQFILYGLGAGLASAVFVALFSLVMRRTAEEHTEHATH